jgi:hypothetical protein
VLALGCDGELAANRDGGAPGFDGGLAEGDAGAMDAGAAPDAGPAPMPEDVSAACPGELCWMAGGLSPLCGTWTTDEDFSSGRYGAHAYTSRLRAGVATTFTARVTGGAWAPAILVLDETGGTVHDGRTGLTTGPVRVTASASGAGAAEASVTLVADADATVTVVITSWANRDAGFTSMLPTDATYDVTVQADCEDTLLTPPNFDETDVVDGYHVLPPSDPEGLYTRKPDGCSRGTRLLIDVIYTAAVRWHEARPDLPPLSVLDLNEGPCSTVDHATHDDGTHVDIHVSCGTEVACADDSAAIDLARILVDTGSVCGILFNDTAVQAEVNPYFFSNYAYEPWDPSGAGRFMRTVSGHTGHFHVRVFQPDGTCN